MPRQNRVTPFSTLLAVSARGTLMGNRGCLHDAHGQIHRRFQGQRWIICVLAFKGRRRAIMTPGQYTELFFLDEATAFAAGHRPCAECQRDRFNLFRAIWATANPELADSAQPTAPLIDTTLHHERFATERPVSRYCDSATDLADGVFVTDDEHNAYMVWRNQLLQWTPSGYQRLVQHAPTFPARVLTPASVVRTLGAGYPVSVHPSAF